MRISDWSSDVCSSDLHLAQRVRRDVADHADEEAVAPETLRDDAAQILDGDARDGGFSAAGRPGVDMLAIHQPAQHAPGDVVGIFCLARQAGDDLAADALDRLLVEARLGQRQTQQLERSEEHTSELQSLMRNSYAVFCLKKKNKQ